MLHTAPQRIVVAGGSGLVGRRLLVALLAQGHSVQILTRTPTTAQLPKGALACSWEHLPTTLEEADALVNLAGEGIADRRWTPARKTAILASRIAATQRLREAMDRCAHPPKVLVNASAIGYYGARGDTPVDESAAPGQGFLSEVCQAWEAEALKAVDLGVRVALLRIGVGG